jgi:hypothetical protein
MTRSFCCERGDYCCRRIGLLVPARGSRLDMLLDGPSH